MPTEPASADPRGRATSLAAAMANPGRLIPLLSALVAFGPMSVDMYLPSLPTIAAEFVATTGDVQLTLSAFFLGFSLGGLLYGPLSDRFGRRPVLLSGILVYIVTSALCAVSASVDQMIAARAFQALGGGAGTVVARAVVRDLFDRDASARIMSLMMLVTGIAPLAAPLVGGQVLLWLGWRAVFWILAGFGCTCWLLAWLRLPETNPVERRKRVSAGAMAGGYLRVLRHRQGVGCILAGSLAFAGMFAYISGTPFVYIEVFGVPPQLFGLLFGVNIVGMMIGAAINSRLVTRLGSGTMHFVGECIVCTAGLALALCAWQGWGGLWGIAVPLFFYVGSLNLISANAVARALHHFPDIAGTASALFGSIQFGLGAVAGALVGQLHNGTAVPMATVIAVAGVLSLLAERTLTKD